MGNTEKVQWMREHGVIEAEWTAGHDGSLVRCKLGPPPMIAGADPLQLTEEEQKRAEEAQKRLLEYLTYGASS